MKRKQSGLLSVTCIFSCILVLAAASLMLPKKELLTLENRKAAALPAFSWDDWCSNRYQERLQEYVNDHIAFRQQWIFAKCWMEELFFQKTEEDGILLGKESQMFTKRFVSEKEPQQFDENVAELVAFSQETTARVSVMLVPSPASVLTQQLPWDAPMESEAPLYERLKEALHPYSTVLDLREAFKAHSSDYLYYRTDHHWTTLGAYYAYAEFCKAKAETPREPDWSQAVAVEDFYGTHYAKTRYAFTISDTMHYFPMPENMVIYEVTGDAEFQAKPPQSIVNEQKLAQYDKYAAFLDGNHAYSVLRGLGQGKLLVVKDSYANCFVPFLLEDYEQVGVLDYRSYAYGLEHLIEKEGYQEVLFLYSMQGFAQDTRLVYINRP